MAIRNLSQEAHLWYTILSPDYVAQAKDELQAAFEFVQERALKHPFISGYAPVHQWTGVMEDLLDCFNHAIGMLRHGEIAAISKWASKMQDIPRGFAESNMEWLSAPDQSVFLRLLDKSHNICGNFLSAIAMSKMYGDPNYKDRSADWRYEVPEDVGIEGDDIARYYEEHIFPILPERIPEYVFDTSISCSTGEIVPWTGVWVPSTGMKSAALAFARQGVQIMQPAYEIDSVDEDGRTESFNLIDCTWHPVRPTGRLIEHPLWADLRAIETQARGRCESGERCPREGWWIAPAAPESRHFQLGEVMPSVDSDYGLTIWQWSRAQ